MTRPSGTSNDRGNRFRKLTEIHANSVGLVWWRAGGQKWSTKLAVDGRRRSRPTPRTDGRTAGPPGRRGRPEWLAIGRRLDCAQVNCGRAGAVSRRRCPANRPTGRRCWWADAIHAVGNEASGDEIPNQNATILPGRRQRLCTVYEYIPVCSLPRRSFSSAWVIRI